MAPPGIPNTATTSTKLSSHWISRTSRGNGICRNRPEPARWWVQRWVGSWLLEANSPFPDHILLPFITKDSDRNCWDAIKIISAIQNSKIMISIPSIVIGTNLINFFPAFSPRFSRPRPILFSRIARNRSPEMYSSRRFHLRPRGEWSTIAESRLR
jgi:hypothetical protein